MRYFLVLTFLTGICSASNYMVNGDFEQALTIGWTQTLIGDGTITRATTYDPDPDYEVYVYKATGTTGYAELSQIANIPTCNIDLAFKAKLYAWDNYSGAWGGAAVVIAYLNSADAVLGETRLCQWSYDCPWTNAADCHVIQVADSLWHDYSYNLIDELVYVPAVDPTQVAKIKITLVAQVVHC